MQTCHPLSNPPKSTPTPRNLNIFKPIISRVSQVTRYPTKSRENHKFRDLRGSPNIFNYPTKSRERYQFRVHQLYKPIFYRASKKTRSCSQSRDTHLSRHIKVDKPAISRVSLYIRCSSTSGENHLFADDGGGGFHKKSHLLFLVGFNYWVRGMRCFPWIGVNFYLKDYLGVDPSTLQLVQNNGNLPMVAKPIYGILSDVIYVGDEHRLPYISIGAMLQVLSWGSMGLIPATRGTISSMMPFILLSNLGASIAEVASDALVAELRKKSGNTSGELQSYACMASAAGGIIGNLSGSYILEHTHPRNMFLLYFFFLTAQLSISLTTRETFLGLKNNSHAILNLLGSSTSDKIQKTFFKLIKMLSGPDIFRPLMWVLASTATLPSLSGTMFYYQTQRLGIDPPTIGLSKVIGQIGIFSLSFIYKNYLKNFPLRKLALGVQILHSCSIFLDILLVKKVNLLLGISDKVYILFTLALAEAICNFKSFIFMVAISNRCPVGFEGFLLAFFAAGMCFSSIISSYLGVFLTSILGISINNDQALVTGIFIQFVATLVPLAWCLLFLT